MVRWVRLPLAVVIVIVAVLPVIHCREFDFSVQKCLSCFTAIENKFAESFQLTPFISARPLIPSVSASDSNVEICSSKTFTSPEYMNVSSATIEPNVAPGITITG